MLVANEFVKLFNLVHEREIGLDYYNWRFDSASNTHLFASWADDKLKGCVGLQSLQVNGFKVGLIVDAMVHPEHRDGVIFAYLNDRIEKYAEDNDLKALIMLPNEQGAHAWSGDKAWKQVKQMATYEVDIDPLPYRAAIHPSFNNDWAGVASALFWEFKSLYPELAIVKRDMRHLAWRFVNHPLHYYTTYLVYDGDFLGYIVLKEFRRDGDTSRKIGDIVDILWYRHSPKMLRKMLRVAATHFTFLGINKMQMWLQTNTILDTIGQEVGFVKTSHTRDFMVKVLDEDYTWLYDPTRWYLTMSDSEIY